MALCLCFSGNAQVNGYFGKRLGLKGYVGSGFSLLSYGGTARKLNDNTFNFGPNPVLGLGAGFVVNRGTMVSLDYARMAASVSQDEIWLYNPNFIQGNVSNYHSAEYLFRLNANTLRLDLRQKLRRSSQPAPEGSYISGFVQRTWFQASAVDSIIRYPANGFQPAEIPGSQIDYSLQAQNFYGMSLGYTASLSRSLLFDFSYEWALPVNYQALFGEDPLYDPYNVAATNSSRFRSVASPKGLMIGTMVMRLSLWFFCA
jgi:hypothetical protein